MRYKAKKRTHLRGMIDLSTAVFRKDGKEKLQLRISNIKPEDLVAIDYNNKSNKWETVLSDHVFKVRYSKQKGKFILFVFNKFVGYYDIDDMKILFRTRDIIKRSKLWHLWYKQHGELLNG